MPLECEADYNNLFSDITGSGMKFLLSKSFINRDIESKSGFTFRVGLLSS